MSASFPFPLVALLPEEVTDRIVAFLTFTCGGCGRKVSEEAGRLCRVCGQKHCRLCSYAWNAFLLDLISPTARQGHSPPFGPDSSLRQRAPAYAVRIRERTQTFYVPAFMLVG
jgi:hypothetical protein